MADIGRLSGKTILVTGAARGIGAAIVSRIRREGGRVIATDRAAGAGVISLDVTVQADWERVLADHEGALDGLVHAAGVCPVASVEETTPEIFRQTMAINTEGAFLAARTAWRALARSDGASIVFIASMAANVTSPLFPAYTASKAGLVGLAKSIALDGARNLPAIRCNTVSPGFVSTDMLSGIGNDLGDAEKHRERSARMSPLKRLASADEIAAPVCFLLSAEASYVTGHDLVVDGGVTAQ